MGAPLRSCSCKEDQGGTRTENNADVPSGISDAEIETLKTVIKEMWLKAETLFEVFHDPKQPELGYRLKVKDNMPIKITLKEDNNFFFGWCAFAPEMSPCSHLYQRSPVKPNGYMGGPASLCNWVSGKLATVTISRSINRTSRYMARLQCRNLERGQELLWNYGDNKQMSIEADWFKAECCRISQVNKSRKRQEKRQNLAAFMFTESCVLCGKPFPVGNKECRVQRKPHFINSHADFLGSEWNGLGPYMQQEVDAATVLIEADKLNALLLAVQKDLKWSLTPACNVMSPLERDQYEDPEALLNEFRSRCDLLKAAGTLVLRGASRNNADFSVDHLKPIPPSVWRTLKWKNNIHPLHGIYSVPKESSEDHEAAVQAKILNFCFELVEFDCV